MKTSPDCMTGLATVGWLSLLPLAMLATACASTGSKEPQGTPPPTTSPGWHTVSGHTCYQPPDFQTLSGSALKMARGEALTEVGKRWQGQIDPSFSIEESFQERLEAQVMANPDQIDTLLEADHTWCIAWARGELSSDAYLDALRRKLSELQGSTCTRKEFELYTQYLDITRKWQAEVPFCQGDRIIIRATGGQFTLEPMTPPEATVWIDAQGDRSRSGGIAGLPCERSDCYLGQLIARFSPKAGGTPLIFPIDGDTPFTIPAHGSLSFAINDLEAGNNQLRIVDGVRDFVSVELRPAPAGAYQ